MPTVPVPRGDVTPIRPLPGGGLRVYDGTEGLRAIGDAVGRLGQTGVAIAEEQDRLEATLDEAAVKRADADDAKWLQEQLWTGDTAYYRQQGMDALNARVQIDKAMEERRAARVHEFKTPRARAMYQEASLARFSREAEGVARYAVGQTQRAEQNASIARLAQASDDAVTSWSDPAAREANTQIALTETRARADREGWDADTLRRTETEVVSGITRRGIEKLVTTGSIDDAGEALNLNRDRLTSEDENALEAVLYQPMFERRIDGLADALFGAAPASTEAEPGAVEGPAAPTIAPTRVGLARALPVTGGQITSRYGHRAAPIAGASTDHRALDVAAPAGTPIVAQAKGRVVSVGPEGDAGNVVRIDYGNGVVFSYAHMQGFDVKRGDVVDAGAQLGRVGSTGNSTGPHVHIVARVNGERVNPEGFNGRVGGSLGGGGGGTTSPPTEAGRDLGKLLAQVDAMNLPFEQEQALKSEVRRRVNEADGIKSRDEANALNEALAVIDAGEASGKPVIKASAIPASVWGRMSPSQKLQVRGVIEQNAKPEPRKTDFAEYTRLSDLYARNPAAFAAVNPLTYRNSLSDDEYKQVIGWRRDALDGNAGGGGKSAKQLTHERIRSVTNPLLSEVGLLKPSGGGKRTRADDEADAEYYRRVGKFRRAVSDDIAIWQERNPGKVPDDNTIRDIADAQLIKLYRKGEDGERDRGAFRFEAPAANGYVFDMPKGDREAIRQEYRRVNGRWPSEQQISEIWRYGARGGR